MPLSTSQTPQKPLSTAPFLAKTLTGVLIVGAIVGGTAALYMKAAAKPEAPILPAIPVDTQRIALQDHYSRTESYAGRLEAAREASLAFERQALIVEILVDEGDTVAAGQVLARLDIAPLNAQRRGLAADRRQRQADLRLARLTTKRQAELHRKGHASAQRFDEARLNAQALEAAIAGIDSTIAAVDIDLAKSVLRAPFDGRIAHRANDEGDIASAASPVLSLLKLGPARVRIGVSPRTAETLKRGDTATMRINGRPYQAMLRALRPDLSQTTRTVSILFEIDATAGIPFGEVAVLELSRRIPRVGAWLPMTALSESVKGLWSISVIAEKDGTPRTVREAVEIIHIAGDRAYVRGSFRNGALVVTRGLNRIAPGQTVAINAER